MITERLLVLPRAFPERDNAAEHFCILVPLPEQQLQLLGSQSSIFIYFVRQRFPKPNIGFGMLLFEQLVESLDELSKLPLAAVEFGQL